MDNNYCDFLNDNLIHAVEKARMNRVYHIFPPVQKKNSLWSLGGIFFHSDHRGTILINCHFNVQNNASMDWKRKLASESLICTMGAVYSPDKCWPDGSYSKMPADLCKYNW